MRPEVVRARVLEGVRPTDPSLVPLDEAQGLVLVEPVVATIDLPPFENSAMDGFAVRAADTENAPVELRLAGRSVAGRPVERPLGPGEACAVTTGAVMPNGADAVVRVEDATVDGARIEVSAPVRPGRDVRRAGEDVRAGDTLLAAGAVMGPGQLTAAAAVGVGEVLVHRRPVVAVLATGDELRPLGVDIALGQIHESATVGVAALVREAGAAPVRRPIVPDDPTALDEALRSAAKAADAVVTVGGVSMGDRDVVRGLADSGRVTAFSVALRPAKPFVFGRIGKALLFGLPGNPASALASFEELVRPAVLAMMGRTPTVRPSVAAELAEPIRQRRGRLHLVRAEVWRRDGRLFARPAGPQGAGMILPLARANAWAVVPAEVEELPAGSSIDVRLIGDPP